MTTTYKATVIPTVDVSPNYMEGGRVQSFTHEDLITVEHWVLHYKMDYPKAAIVITKVTEENV